MSKPTHEFFCAVADGAKALRDDADEISRDRMFTGKDSVADILHTAVERKRQQAAMLEDWCKRTQSHTEVAP